MSYNTRRGGTFAPSNSAASVGQRRAAAPGQQGGNFGASGVNPNAANKPGVQSTPGHQLQQQGQQQQGGVQRPTPAQLQQQQQKPPTPIRQTPVQQGVSQQGAAQQQQQQQQQITPHHLQQQRLQHAAAQQAAAQQQAAVQQQGNLPQQPKVVFKTEQDAPISVERIGANGNEVMEAEEQPGEDGAIRKRRRWPPRLRATPAIRRERLKARNERMRRALQPKNALMILNELVTGVAFNVAEGADVYEGSMFKCSVIVDGKEHFGLGKSKPAAKGSAAEAALKHLVLTKYKTASELQTTSQNTSEQTSVQVPTVSGEEKMDTNAEDTTGPEILWAQVASYALHKLLNEWDEGDSLVEKMFSSHSVVNTPANTKPLEKRPSKKLPDTATTMNPVMLLNQMHPNAVYEDVGRIGSIPHILFTVQCTVEGQVFNGTASNKKAARKVCAFGACIKVLGIQYSQAFLEENGVAVDGAGNVVSAAAAVTAQQPMQVA